MTETYNELDQKASSSPADGSPMGRADGSTSQRESLVISKVSKHLLWFLFLLFVFSFLDRINIGFAGLTMMKDLGLTGTQFGLATSMFYIAYIVFSIPSNVVLARIGARKWIAIIMVAWGLASTATMFASSPDTLYGLRILVGITEAGFLPGMLLYLTYWFPSAYRERANALFMIAMPVTAAIGRQGGRHRPDQRDGEHRFGAQPGGRGVAERRHAQFLYRVAVCQRLAGGGRRGGADPADPAGGQTARMTLGRRYHFKHHRKIR